MDMKVLNLLSAGGVGGIEQLCCSIAKHAKYENIFCFLFEEGYIYEEMKKNGYHVVSLVNCSKNKISKERWKRLCELVEDADIVVTHHCTIALHSYYIALAHHFKNKKFVMTIHSCFEREQNYHYESWMKNTCAKIAIILSLKKSHKVVFVSEAGRRSYLDNFDLDQSKTVVIYNGVETNDYKISDKTKEDYIRITYIGRLEQIKGIDLLVNALKILYEHNIKFKAWIIGDGSCRDQLEKLVKSYKLNDCVEFTGIKRSLNLYLEKTDIFVYPSICQEVFGISIVEAMSYGVICVANNVGGIPEIIKNGYNGYITSEITEEELFRCIYNIVQLNADKRLYLEKNCLATAEFFCIENTLASLKKMFEELIKDDN